MAIFDVGLTRDFLTSDGTLVYRDIGLGVLDADPGVRHRFLERHESLIPSDLLRDVDAVISLTPRYARTSFTGLDRLAVLVRFGVGYDTVDVDACTDADVVLCITAGAVNHSVAEAIITWMLALGHRVADKDRLVRQGRWADRGHFMGRELRGRTLGVIGLGGIGGRLIEMLAAFGMNPPLAFDPYLPPERAAALGVTAVPLERVLRESDFVSINCPLTPETRGLLGPAEIALMKPTAFLINTARGGIVDETALHAALVAGRIAGAGIDVFATEPAGADHPFARLDNVLLAPHAIAWTDELFEEIGRTAARAVLDVAHGRTPARGVVNPAVLARPGFQAKLARWRR